MFDKMKAAIPGAIVSFIVTLFLSFFAFWGQYSVLAAQVQANTEKVKNVASKEDIQNLEESRKRANERIVDRIDRVDAKVTDVYKILIQMRKD